MWNFFPRQVQFVPPGIIWVAVVVKALLLLGELCKSKVSCFIELLCTWTTQKIPHRKLDHHCAVPLLRRLASSVSWERSFLVFHEWLCSCIAVCLLCATQSSSTCSTRSSINSGSCHCIVISSFLGLCLFSIFIYLSHYYMFRPTCVASTGSLQILAKKVWVGMCPVLFQ